MSTNVNDTHKSVSVNVEMIDENCKIQESEQLIDNTKSQRNPQLYIEFNDLSYSAVCLDSKGTKKTILHNVTGHFKSSKLTVIIGPSGAGKTTLLKILSGERLVNVKGTITINGVKRNNGTFRKQIRYVPQQFSLLPLLTTRETLYIAARFNLDSNQSEQRISLIINKIVENLGLSKCLNTLANKLSGGEKKRLSIGVEMIIKPSVLFLDEPTSGLDSVASNQLISMLHDMTRANCTVVCAVHQPSSQMISQFDDIMVLSQGRCMYFGPRDEILPTFSDAGFTCPNFYNIAEFVLEVITEQRGGDLDNLYEISRDMYQKSKLRNEDTKNEASSSTFTRTFKNDVEFSMKRKLSMWQQQKVLFLRALICIKRDSIMTWLRFAAHIVVAILLGIVFYDFGDDAQKVQSNIAYLFFVLLFLFFANSVPAVLIFPTEAAVFIQEHLNNWYDLKSYYIVKILTDLPLQILCSSFFLLISFYMSGQPMDCNRIFQAWSVCILITILGQTYGILVGSAFNTEIGIFFIPASSIPLLLFAGFFVKLKEMSVYLQHLGTINFFRYAFVGIIQAVYVDRPNLTCLEIYCYLKSPRTILSTMDISTVSFFVIVIMLGSWILCLHFITYAILYWKIDYAKK